MKILIRYATILVFCAVSINAIAKDSTMLVLDASGSMWGQIDKIPKIQIARDALKKLVADWPEERETGLIVYGHRIKGSCTDIQTVIPVGPMDAAEMGKIVDKISPKGKTPLSAAVKKAAEEMKYTEDKATVILISDGKETCDMDPCALGEELEKLGVDFTAHVIGFDVMSEDQTGLRCLAENTGGDFISASDAKELNEALTKIAQVVEPEPVDVPLSEVMLKAPDSVVSGADFYVELEAPEGTDGRVYLYAQGKDRHITYQRIQAGKVEGFKPILLRAPAKTGDYVVKFLTLKNEVVTEKGIQVVEADVSLNTPEEVIKSSKVHVELIAPPGIQGRIYLYAKGKKKPVTYQRVLAGKTEGYSPVFLRVPAKTGEYELKFRTLRNEVLAEKTFTVIDAKITLEAPESAPISTDINVIVSAPPGIDGRLYIHRKGKQKSITYQRLRKGVTEDYQPVKLRLPARPGDYVIKLRSLKNEMLAETEIKVEEADITLNAPESVPIATRFIVTIDAPEGMDGRVYLMAKGKAKAYDEQRLFKDAIQKYQPVKLHAPAKAGEYLIKFTTLRRELLEETTIKVTEAKISLNAPNEAIKESPIEVTPVGPPGMDGRIYLYKTGKRKAISQHRIQEGAIEDYDPVRIKLPDVAGDYELKFLSLKKELLVEHKLKVTDSEP